MKTCLWTGGNIHHSFHIHSLKHITHQSRFLENHRNNPACVRERFHISTESFYLFTEKNYLFIFFSTVACDIIHSIPHRSCWNVVFSTNELSSTPSFYGKQEKVNFSSVLIILGRWGGEGRRCFFIIIRVISLISINIFGQNNFFPKKFYVSFNEYFFFAAITKSKIVSASSSSGLSSFY